MTGPSLVWFRQDLRLADNPALAAAVARGALLIPFYVLDETTPARWAPGGASRWWLHHSLAALAEELERRGARLVLRRGAAAVTVPRLAKESGAAAVFWNRHVEPFWRDAEAAIETALGRTGVAVESFNATLLREPAEIATKNGTPFKVFTPFWRALRTAGDPPTPRGAPRSLPGGAPTLPGDALADWSLLPSKPDWAGGLRACWRPGEAGASERLGAFLDQALHAYEQDRDRPDLPGTARLSPHLHWGEIGPRQVWHATLDHVRAAGGGPLETQAWAFLRQLGWREFSRHLLYHWPRLPEAPWKAPFAAFPWREDQAGLRAWCAAETGYPIVDAGLRELWTTGWMHNRVRMIAASFLVKHLLIPWQQGEAWFWDTLVDADLANNAASWQWVAGSGADAAPYFRIFNPVRQGERFDPEGAYLRRWLPELAALSDSYIHRPWTAPADGLAAAGVTLGRSYPKPIVDHAAARQRALAAYDRIKRQAD